MKQHIIDAVENVIKKYGTSNPRVIAEKMGVIVNYCSLGDTIGFTMHNRRQRFININSDSLEPDREFGLSHELGHIVLHNDLNTPFYKKNVPINQLTQKEREANEFAIYLSIRRYEDEHGEVQTQYKHLGIPDEMLVYLQ